MAFCIHRTHLDTSVGTTSKAFQASTTMPPSAPLTPQHCQQLITILNQQMTQATTPSPSNPTTENSSTLNHFLDPTQHITIGIAKKLHNLYVLPSSSASSSSIHCNSCTNVNQWHSCLGHPSLLITKSINKTLHFSDSSSSNPCSICHLGKKKLHFISNNNFAPKSF
ncbi:uncharacterized protein LOC133816035 [Humulus lupulus]|uniref:uncharacterized protein LOC133816035 n=1 Tax=Humulus lupulus TaxID=3486 RepID=UPI002B41717F|nr:uncharacterized protein LOC133816035 [Humulus lupulus]